MENMKTVRWGSDFSGVGAADYALKRLSQQKGFNIETVYACDWDKFARITYEAAHGLPPYYPKDVYDREIPKDSLDLYVTSPPCQAFSLAGKRLGKEDKRGILFFNSHEFIQENKPRFFIFENVKGLLSDDGGKTFQEWVNMLGGKSVNGVPVLFPYDDSVPYHVYWKVLNAKEHGVPQNRERVFIIGIRDDQDNNFRFPIEEHLTKRLKDVLENQVNEKYFLSEKMLNYLETNTEKQKENGNGFKFLPSDGDTIGKTVTCKAGQRMDDEFIKIKSVLVSKEVRTYESKKKRKETGTNDFRGKEIEFRDQDHMNTVTTSLTNDHLIKLPSEQDKQPKAKYNIKRLNQTLEKHDMPKGEVRFVDSYNQSVHENASTITSRINATNDRHLWDGYKIRRLTPLECFRLMDFPDEIVDKARSVGMSDSQLYKQAGNSIVVRVLEKIFDKLPL